jgi:hypothetical protein
MLQENERLVTRNGSLELRCIPTCRDRIENEVSLMQPQATIVRPRWTKSSARLILVMTILIVRAGTAEVRGLDSSAKFRRGLSEAPQIIPLTLAMLRLIERIRLADICVPFP